MKKADISLRYENGREYPALNVKFYRSLYPVVHAIMVKFGCSEEVAQKALQFAYESAVEGFWQNADAAAQLLFRNAQVQSVGRSGGWLIVDGLPPVASWDAIMVGKWSRFVKGLEQEMMYRSSKDSILEDVEANRWAEEGAEAYNFVEREGKIFAVPDLKRIADDAVNAHIQQETS